MIKNVFLSPMQKFIKIESLSGVLLLLATLVAIIWVNSPYAETYYSISKYQLGFTSNNFELNKPIILWVNDGLMAVFFFLIGLEVKRELLLGELNSIKKLTFPLVGAIGGMSVPVIMYILLNKEPSTSMGWGIPMATDIAFSLAVLKALGNRIPLSLKIFLTAFAIIDDIGAVLVIAIFYSSGINYTLLGIALFLLIIIFTLNHRGYYSRFSLFIFGIAIWVLFLKSGIHPTLAGILVAFTVPIRQRINTTEFTSNLELIVKRIKNTSLVNKPILTKEQISQIDDLQDWTTKYQSPLQYLEHKLHDWVAYIIVPIFALVNAGVSFNSNEPIDYALVRNIILCLVIGNTVGITTIVWIAKKLHIIDIPQDINRWHIVGVSALAGIGFTMAIFFANLTFNEQATHIDSAKIGILVGSLLAAVLGYLILRIGSKKPQT